MLDKHGLLGPQNPPSGAKYLVNDSSSINNDSTVFIVDGMTALLSPAYLLNALLTTFREAAIANFLLVNTKNLAQKSDSNYRFALINFECNSNCLGIFFYDDILFRKYAIRERI